MPVYKIDVTDGDGKIVSTRAVQAPNVARALNHVRDTILTADRIEADEAFAMRDRGIRLEVAGDAGEEPQPALPLGG